VQYDEIYRKPAIFDSVVFLSRTATVRQRAAVVTMLHADGRMVPASSGDVDQMGAFDEYRNL